MPSIQRVGMIALITVLATAGSRPGARGRSDDVPPPPAERLPALAAALAVALEGETVSLPDGSRAAIVSSPTPESGAPPALLTTERIETCLATIGEADAWPSAWLVVQIRPVSYDLVMPVRLTPGGEIEKPAPIFATERREWDVDALRRSVREATGGKARGRSWNLVIQSFSKRIVERFVYEAPEPGSARGLMALLPPGSLLREARTVDLGDDRHHTLAVVLREAEFLPSACDTCASALLGHADTGRVLLVLAGSTEIEDTLDITPLLARSEDRPVLPRYACEAEDEDPSSRDRPVGERFAGRRLAPLIRLEDLDGDGRPLELALPADVEDCDRPLALVLGVNPASRKLRVVSALEDGPLR